MTRRFPLIFCLLLSQISPLSAGPEKPATPLEATLVATYQSWRNSMIEGDYQAWLKHTAAYRRAITRNNIVSQKLKFPDALFEVPMKPASIDGLKPIQARERGMTSQLVYYGKIDVGLELPEDTVLPDNLLILKFIKEGKEWKFNTLSLLNLEGADEIKAQIKNEDYEFLNKGNFKPPGWVPEVPKECPTPDYVGQIQVTSFGYNTEITINGTSTHRVSDTATSGLIIGGLKNTLNKIAVYSRPIGAPKGDDPDQEQIPNKLEITIFSLPENGSTEAHKAWHYNPKKVLPSYKGAFIAVPR